MSIVRALLPGSRDTADALLECPGCGTPFRPARTRGECPVCGWRERGSERRLAPGNADALDIAVVAVVMSVNLGLLALLVFLVLRQS